MTNDFFTCTKADYGIIFKDRHGETVQAEKETDIMPRNRVFISYSHKDETFFQAFRVHLKPWEDQELLDIWSDHNIEVSEDWHRKIQHALESTTVAVLLVSPNFLASDYIRQHELPELLRAREEGDIDLTCLYLRDSIVDDDDAAVEVELSSGETRRVKLTKYQGFNDPQAVVAGLEANKRDGLYAHAASTLKNLVRRKMSKPVRSPGGKRFELTVQFKLDGSQLTRSYFHHYGRIDSYRSPWQ